MSEKNIIRYTDEEYVTKDELKQSMKIIDVEPYWRDILSYRHDHSVELQINTIAKKPLWYTNSFGVKSSFDTFVSLCNSYISNLKAIVAREQYNVGEKDAFRAVLRGMARFSNIEVSDNVLNAILMGTYIDADPKHNIIQKYYSLMHKLFRGEKVNLDEQTAKNIYKLFDETETNPQYRERDYNNSARITQERAGLVYPYAPSSRISGLMSELPIMFRDSESSPMAKALAVIYFIDLVKPFESHNDIIGCALAKIILSQTSFGQEAFLLPLEEAISGVDNFSVVSSLVQSMGDMTYYFKYAFKVVGPYLTTMTGKFKDLNIDYIRSENRSLSLDEKRYLASQNKQKYEQINIFTASTAEEKKPLEEKQEQVEEKVAESEEEPIEEEAPQKKIETITKEEFNKQQASSELSIEMEGNPLSPKDIKDFIKYLLEIDPNLNKNQASFLANHCQMGRYYTIQQFKKFTKCAYETARTSMDKLAESNYYKKMQVKNKFVYTPVKNKGEK
ncbi:MAG: hypothetical protein IJ247_01585 [Bacilli bacterium]|nr:hypothetical protein [Bacilli bacterium]